MSLKESFNENKSGNKIKIVNLSDDFEKVTNDCYGTDWYELSEEDLKAIIEGKVLLLEENDGEYQMFLKLKKEK